jgi:hypothetical protein
LNVPSRSKKRSILFTKMAIMMLFTSVGEDNDQRLKQLRFAGQFDFKPEFGTKIMEL